MIEWIKNHFETLHHLHLNTSITNQHGQVISLDQGFLQYVRIINTIDISAHKLIFIGNGGSAGIASHLAIDYSKNGHLPAVTFTDAAALTCLSNDYGYEHVFAKQIEFHARAEDILIAISSSGQSKNILNAVSAAKIRGCRVITFSGFTAGNPLAQMGDLNFYVDSHEYGFVEVAHLALGHALLDYIIEQQHQQEKQTTSQLHATLEAVQ